jgi:hypothetical protein
MECTHDGRRVADEVPFVSHQAHLTIEVMLTDGGLLILVDSIHFGL